jgi:hypothetical protein
LEKRVWWLQYEKGSHNLGDIHEQKDYTVRYTQYFDHYLKNAPAPAWMTQGIYYKDKGRLLKLELDPAGSCSVPRKPCAICEAWNKQYKRTPEMFQKEIKDWALDKDVAAELELKQKERRKELDKEGEIERKKVLKILKSK